MSSAETTHPIEWRDDGAGGATAHVNGWMKGRYWASPFKTGEWIVAVFSRDGRLLHGDAPTASAARSFVEKSVKEAGHGE